MSGPAVPAANEKALARRIKDHVIGRRHEFYAVVHPGFEETARRELAALGVAADAAAPGGVAFSGRLEDAWRANLGAGTLSRVLMRVGQFKATGFSEFRAKMAALPWELHVAGSASVGFAVSAARSRLWHEGKIAEEAERALRERLAAHGRRVVPASPAGPAPGQLIFLRLDGNRCQASLDTSGELLYRRGRGKFTEEAPLRETLACAILREGGIGRCRTLVDPFCGSGTFALEAGAILLGRPANLERSFAFQSWPSFRPARFRFVKEGLEKEMRGRAPAGPFRIFCSDIDGRAAETARRNVEAAGLGGTVEVDQADFFRLHPPTGPRSTMMLAMNPPYGARQLPGGDIASLYRRIGEKVRRDYAGCGYAILVPGLENEKALGLAHDRKILFHNGGIPVALLIKTPVTSNK